MDQQLDLDDPRITEPAPAPPAFEVVVTRSAKRRKTAQATLVGNRLEIRIPSHVSAKDEADFVQYFSEKFRRKADSSQLDLDQRARELAARYGLQRPDSIRWVSNQAGRWGSCTPSERTVRLSDRLARFPEWVIDYVIVHELAHLDEAGHGHDFWELVNRYPRAERARGFLIAQSWGSGPQSH
ncbi:MAG: M48 family metallopeptidase [Acidimicrobiales bacterium]